MFSTPEVRIHVPEDRKFEIPKQIGDMVKEEGIAKVNDMDGIRVTSEAGWWLLRASNTESVLSLRVESFTEDGLQILKHQLEDHLKSVGIDFAFHEEEFNSL